MEPDKSLRTIFNGALDHDDPAARSRYLDEACGPDPALRGRVEALLNAHDSAGGFFSDTSKAPDYPETLQSFAVPLTEKPGDTIGRYKLLQQIGEGGCGVVYMAEQEEPVRRRVALKVIKLGMDTKQVIARFEAERQALALMDHANIARVLDAGATDTGRPYFVMELVRGIRITDYCDQNNLTTEARLGLFNQVCSAIQHAHQKGIIHRDIKPSNILVTLHDGVPVPKVIDFGIAKATTGQRLTDKTVFTAFEQFIGTPAYMSPEQAEMSGLDIDTRSDIYALGVLLYELLTGQTPFDSRELLAAGLDAMRRTIREQEPPRPSTRLSTMLAADLNSVARHHQSESLKLTHSIRGDLDWIVMKALEKDRTRRYETANGLALDIQRHLHNEPVTARPASNLYRFRKLARRNQAAFAAAGAVAAALVIGILVSTWQAVRATRAEQEQSRLREEAQENAAAARTEAGKSEQVAQFLKDMLKGVGPSVALGRDTRMLREILDKTTERVGTDLEDQPEVEADLRIVIGEVYFELADYAKSGAMYGRSLELRRSLFGREDPKVADALSRLANTLAARHQLAEAEAMHREALAMRRMVFGNEHQDVARSLNGLGEVLRKAGKLPEAESLFREALAIRRNLLGNGHSETSDSLQSLSYLLYLKNQLAESEITAREALAIERKLHSGDHPGLAHALNDLARVLVSADKRLEAEVVWREALNMFRKIYGNDHPDVAMVLGNLGIVLSEQDKLAEAEAMYREALAVRRLRGELPDVVQLLQKVGRVLDEQDKLTEAEPIYREMLDMARKTAAGDARGLEDRMYQLAENLRSQGKYAEAEPLTREILRSRRARLAAEDHVVLATMATLARLLTDWAWAERGAESAIVISEAAERAREAERLMRDCLAIWMRGNVAQFWRTDDARSRLGSALVSVAVTDPAIVGELRIAKLTEAEQLLLEGNDAVQSSEDSTDVHKRDALSRIVRLYEVWDKPDKLEEWQRKLADFDKIGSLTKQAGPLRREGKLAEAVPLLREALELWTKLGSAEYTQAISLRHDLASNLRDLGKPAEAEPLYREGLEIARKHAATDPGTLEHRLIWMADVLHRQGKYAEGEPLYRELIEHIKLHPDGENGRGSSSVSSLARLLTDWAWAERGSLSAIQNLNPEVTARAQEAERLLRDCLAERLKTPIAEYWRTDELRSRLGAALVSAAVTDPALSTEARVAKFTEAEVLLLQSNNALQQCDTTSQRYQRDSLTRLVRLYEAWEKPGKAAEWQQKLDAFDKAHAKPETGTGAAESGL